VYQFLPDDAAFILELLNEPAFIRNIGDRGVRNLEDARHYIQHRLLASYEGSGFGLYRVDLKERAMPIGMCGFIKRPELADVDIGYALLERFWLRGYACEAASAVLEYGRKRLGLKRVVAITAPYNVASSKVLEKLGFRFERMLDLPNHGGKSKFYISEG
jgi:RimJ/RimL family protein N-acetyltransferase